MRAQSDVTAALLIWLSDGDRPSSGDFRGNPRLRSSPHSASCRTRDGRRFGHAGRLPWIKVGSRVFDPDQVRSARSTVNDVKGRSPYTA